MLLVLEFAWIGASVSAVGRPIYPDLITSPPSGLYIERGPDSTYLLRFANTAVNLGGRQFVGSEAIEQFAADKTQPVRVGLSVEGKRVARQGLHEHHVARLLVAGEPGAAMLDQRLRLRAGTGAGLHESGLVEALRWPWTLVTLASLSLALV